MTTVSLKVHCKKMKSPKTQLPKFEGTLEEGFWKLANRISAEKFANETVKTITEWVRDFKEGKSPKQIVKTTRNLLIRAAEYAEILELEAEIAIDNSPPEIISHKVDKPSDYFKTKSWK